MTQDAPGITFDVAKVERGTHRIERIPVAEAVHQICSPGVVAWEQAKDGSSIMRVRRPPVLPVEACMSAPAGVAQVDMHPLLGAAHVAFDKHLPLVLSPDDIWLTLAQGFAHHVLSNSEEFRAAFVDHEARQTITVRRDDFIKGSADNDWLDAIELFSLELEEHLGSRHDLVVASFSTTGLVERAASQLTLMYAMQSYFEYELITLCGIPEITLLGTAEDWRQIRRRVDAFSEFGLKPWVKVLRPLLDQFVRASQGQVDRAFWRQIYKLDDESGGPYVSGWLQTFFPYALHADGSVQRRAGLASWSQQRGWEGLNTNEFPQGLCSVPFVWDHLGTRYAMELLGGFVGIDQDASLAVRPRIGWCVRETR